MSGCSLSPVMKSQSHVLIRDPWERGTISSKFLPRQLNITVIKDPLAGSPSFNSFPQPSLCLHINTSQKHNLIQISPSSDQQILAFFIKCEKVIIFRKNKYVSFSKSIASRLSCVGERIRHLAQTRVQLSCPQL